ncbi:DUF2333 family protein [Methylothermus subterraneus]
MTVPPAETKAPLGDSGPVEIPTVPTESEALEEETRQKRRLWGLGGILGGIGLALFALGWYWSYRCFSPSTYDVTEIALKETGVTDPKELKVGARTTAVLIHNMDYLLIKPGGYLSNDVTPPSVLLDNMPNWEFGVVVASRDLATALRNQFSRAQSQSPEDSDLGVAEPYYYFETESWILPATENQYQKGIDLFRRYLKRLQEGRANFYARADNLTQYVDILAKRLGGYTQRLSASSKLHEETPLTIRGEPSTAFKPLERTPWLEVDDHFYEARGYCWALLHIMRALEQDFHEILRVKGAETMVHQIIVELEATQATILSPVVLNGSGFGIFANYSLTLATYIAHANAALIDLRAMLSI